MRSSLAAWLATPVSGGSLALLRVGVGTALAWRAAFLASEESGLSRLWLLISGDQVAWRIPWPGLEAVGPWPEPWMTVQLWALIAVSALLAVGAWPRLMAALACFAWTHTWLCDAMLGHDDAYLLSLLTFLLIWMPSGRRFAVGNLLRRLVRRPALPDTVPRWCVGLLRAQFCLVWTFAGLARLARDFLSRHEPMASFLADALPSGEAAPEAEGAAHLLESAPFVALVSWSEVLVPLVLAPLLLLRRTRYAALALAAAFFTFRHVAVFGDGTAPLLLALSGVLVFLAPDWPSRLLRWLRRPGIARPDLRWAIPGLVLLPGAGALLGWAAAPSAPIAGDAPPGLRRFALAGLVAWLAVQVVVPLRPWLIDGDVRWTTEGEKFSWRGRSARRARDLHAIIVRDDELVAPSPTGEGVTVAWPLWQGPRMTFVHVDSRSVRWEDLPPVIIVREPLVGERLFFNTFSRATESDLTEAVGYLTPVWKEVHGREPALSPTISLFDGIEELLVATAQWGADAPGLLELYRIRANLQALRDGTASEHERLVRTHRMRQDLVTLLASESHGAAVRRALERCHPFAWCGAPDPPLPFLLVEDPEVFRFDGAFRRIDRTLVKPFWGRQDYVLADLRRFDTADWLRLPPVMPLELPSGQVVFWINFAVDDILADRRNWLAVHPPWLKPYADRVARGWEDAYGRRPAVHVRFYASVNGEEPRLVTDPTVDVAAEPVRALTHAPWVLPENDHPPPPSEPLAY